MLLRVNVFLPFDGARRPYKRQAMMAFHKALLAAGERTKLVPESEYHSCEIAVVFGFSKERVRAAHARTALHRSHRGAFIVLDTPFLGRAPYIEDRGLRALIRRLRGKRNAVDRFGYFRIGINGGFHDDGDFANAGSPPDRWERLRREFGLELRPYRKDGSQVLIVGQVPGDASLRGCDIIEWMNATAREVMRRTDRPIVIRPHPNTKPEDFRRMAGALQGGGRVGIDLPPKGTIAEALRDAWVTVTYSSSAAIDSLLAGVPAIAMSPANMAWPVTDHDLSKVESPSLHPREQWLYDLAYAQWSTEEIASGGVWARLKPEALASLEQRISA